MTSGRQVRLVRAGAEHAAALAALHETAFADHWPEPAFRSLLSGAGTGAQLGVEPGGAPVGFVLWRCVAEEAEILTIAVTPERRRLGYGGALLSAAEDQARLAGARRMILEVAADNRAALALYQMAGYRLISRRTAYYAPRQPEGEAVDAMLMARRLERPDQTLSTDKRDEETI